jgi:hypothetical protein
MLETLFLLTQPPRIDYCALKLPVTVCVRYQVRYSDNRSQYFVGLTNGSSEFEVNRCTYWRNPVGAKFKYAPETPRCN